MTSLTVEDVRDVAAGYHPDPARSMSLRSQAYTDPRWLDANLPGG